MRQFQSAAVDSMGTSNPGFAGFMNGMMNSDPSPPGGAGPPPPMATQHPSYGGPTRERPGNNNASYGRSSVAGDNINIKEVNTNQGKSARRPEMKGPSDIDDILSGLKTKSINIQEPKAKPSAPSPTEEPVSLNDSSTISISDLKDLQTDGNLPKKSKRRQGSNKNTISLDI